MLYREIIAVFSSDPHKTHKCTASRTQNFLMFQLALHKVILMLSQVNHLNLIADFIVSLNQQ